MIYPHKNAWIALMSLLSLGAHAQDLKLSHPPEGRQKVLITAFKPFAGRKLNLSYEVAKQIKSNLPLLTQSKIEADLCLLPVAYDKAAAKAQACYEKLEIKPSLVLSLGEGNCTLRIETASHNLDDSPGFPDNDGQIRSRSTILPGLPPSYSFRFPGKQMYCSLPKMDRQRVSISPSPGAFVCNNTAFRLAHYFDPVGVEYGFIHIPPEQCGTQLSDPARQGATIAQMIADVLQERAQVTPECSEEFDEKLGKYAQDP